MCVLQWQPASEQGVSGVAVQLLQNGVVVNSTTTDATGRYSFANVPPGTYSVQFTAPTGYSLSTYPSGSTGAITLASGQAYLDADIGLYQGERLACMGSAFALAAPLAHSVACCRQPYF